MVENSKGKVYYQTEIKNWTSFSFGVPKTLSTDTTNEQLYNFAYKMFERQWDSNNQTFKMIKQGKCFYTMQPPNGYNIGQASIQPLICYWLPVTNATNYSNMGCIIDLPCNENGFNSVKIFLLHYF